MLTPLLISGAIGYLLGALPFGYLVARAKGVNIFEVGSRSPGATNVKRVLGAKAGNLVFALDAVKGLVATAVPLVLTLGGDPGTLGYDAGGVAGLIGAVLGHSFSCFTKFKGGKGVATAAGGLLVLAPLTCLLGLATWVAVFFSFRYVSMASIASAVVVGLVPWLTNLDLIAEPTFPWLKVSFVTLLAILVVVRHKANIQRLLAGTEHRWERKPPARVDS